MDSSNNKEHLRNFAIAAVSSVPVVGGPASFLLDKYVPNYLSVHRTSFVKEIEDGLKSLEQLDIKTEINNERFMSTLVRCIQIADGESSKVKLSALRSIALNTSLPCDKDFDENSLFIRLLETLTSDQIRILKAIYHDSKIFLNADNDIYDVLSKHFPLVDKDYMSVCTQELVSWNLIASRNGANAHRTALKSQDREDRTHYLTAMGERFFSLISPPYGV